MSTNNENFSNQKDFSSDTSIDNNRGVEESINKIEQDIEQKEFSKKKLHIAWRRGKILEYLADGQTNQTQIAEELKVSQTVVCEDIQYLKAEAKERIKTHLEERLPFVFETCLVRLEKTKLQAIEIYNKTEAPRIRLQALSLINETAVRILDLMTHNETVLTAMSMTNKLNKQIDILKDKAESEQVITVTNTNDSQRSEDDTTTTGESESTTESDTASATADNTAEQDSRVF